MNIRRPAIATLAIFVFALLWNGFIHMVVLREANTVLEGIARPPADRNLLLSLLLTAGIALLFMYSYVTCVRHAGIRQGLAHGVFFGLLAGLLVDLNQFMLYPIPASLAVSWFLAGLVEFCVDGTIAAWLCPFGEKRPAAPPERKGR